MAPQLNTTTARWKNLLIVILILMVILLLAYIFFKINVRQQEAEHPKFIKVDSVETSGLTERQMIRKATYERLVDEMVEKIDKVDTVSRDCGTILTPSQYDKIAEISSAVCGMEKEPSDTNAFFDFPLYVYLVTGNAIKVTISREQVARAVALMNDKFKPVKIKFSIKGESTVVNDTLVNFHESLQGKLTNRYRVNGHINIYIFNTVTSRGGAPLNGYTSFNTGEDFIILTAQATVNGTTLPHEMGHYFTLFHTHGKDGKLTDELVNGTSCSCKGDDVCDTPADPDLRGKVTDNCVYIGQQRDDNGELFLPDPGNIMSYAHHCRNYFTRGQYRRMRVGVLEYRGYLVGL